MSLARCTYEIVDDLSVIATLDCWNAAVVACLHGSFVLLLVSCLSALILACLPVLSADCLLAFWLARYT